MAKACWLRLALRVWAKWLIVAIAGALPGSAETPNSIQGIYRGTIGHQEIVMDLEGIFTTQHGNNYGDPGDRQTYPVRGFYFYRRHGVSIDLAGMPMPDGSLRLREYRQLVKYEFTAEWQIRIEGDVAEGTFCKCDLSRALKPGEEELPIRLKRLSHELSTSAWDDYKPHSGDIYDDLLLDFPLDQGAEIQVNEEIAYRMWTDSRFKVSRPKLTRFPDARVMGRINANLSAELTESRLWTAACLSGGQATGAFGGFYEETTRVVAFPPDVLSIVVERAWYCGAVHGDASAYALNYNLHTGKRFELDQSLQTSAGGTTEKDVALLLGKLYLRHYVKPIDADEGPYIKPSGEEAEINCQEVIRETTSGKDEPFSATLYLSEEGLVISPALLYLQKGCGPPITIPYRELRPFAKPHSMLKRVVEAKAGKSAEKR